jgi:hypothetical protein
VIEFYPLPLGQIELEDLRWLHKSLGGEEPDAVREQLLDGRAIMWRYRDSDNSGRGIVVLQEFTDEIFIWHLGGINIRPGMFFIIDTIAEFAKARGRKRVRCLAPKALLKTYKRLGLDVDKYMLRREV